MNSSFWQKVGSGVVEFLIFMQKCGFIMIAEGIKYVQDDSVALGILGMVIGIMLMVLIFFLDVCVIYGIYYVCKRMSIKMRTKKTEYHKAIGRVTNKEHKSSYMSTVLVGKNFLPVYHSEEYNVYVHCKGLTKVFDSERLFKQYKKGDPIKVIMVGKFDKHDNLIEATLELPE